MCHTVSLWVARFNDQNELRITWWSFADSLTNSLLSNVFTNDCVVYNCTGPLASSTNPTSSLISPGEKTRQMTSYSKWNQLIQSLSTCVWSQTAISECHFSNPHTETWAEVPIIHQVQSPLRSESGRPVWKGWSSWPHQNRDLVTQEPRVTGTNLG